MGERKNSTLDKKQNKEGTNKFHKGTHRVVEIGKSQWKDNHVREDWVRWDYSAYVSEGSGTIFLLCLYTWWERVKKVESESSQGCCMLRKVAMGPKEKTRHSLLR